MNVPQTMQARSEDKKRNLEVLDPEQWWMEKKLDGFRLLVVAGDDGDPAPAGFSRAGNDQLIEARTPRIFADLDDLLPGGYTVIDGEMSTADDDFTHVAGVMKSLPPKAVEKQEAADKHLEFVVFDVLWWDGVDLRALPQWARRNHLENHLPSRTDAVRLTETHPLSRETILGWQAAGGEGAILKNRDAPYVCGKRPLDTWLKIKAIDDADVVVTGFTQGQGKYEDQVGAVQFGQYRKCDSCDDGTFTNVKRLDMITTEETCNVCDGRGTELVTRGQCSGMTDELRLDITRNSDQYLGRVMVVQHMGIQRDGFRHPQFKGFRDDKLPEQCEWDM